MTASLDVPNLDVNGDLLGQLGMGASIKPQFDRVPLGSVIPVGVAQAWEQSGQMLSGIRDLVTGRAFDSRSDWPDGPDQSGSWAPAPPLWVTLAQLAIPLSLNLAVLNLLLPCMDGRQTIVRHRRGPPRREEVAGTRGDRSRGRIDPPARLHGHRVGPGCAPNLREVDRSCRNHQGSGDITNVVNRPAATHSRASHRRWKRWRRESDRRAVDGHSGYAGSHRRCVRFANWRRRGEIVRIAVPDRKAAAALPDIVPHAPVPLSPTSTLSTRSR